MDKVKIENATTKYWRTSHKRDPDIYLQEYICEGKNELCGKSLLEAELEWAEDNNGITAKHCETLVLLVGFSLEPLLQSACVHKPTKIALLLNEEGYLGKEWQVFAQHLMRAIKYLRRNGFDGSKVQFLGKELPAKPGYSAKGDPASVFKTLVKSLHNEEDVVIDITGGKKSMVAGAFMYAAYAGARISYVDFEEYDPDERRPYGFGCKIGELTNPYEKFALHEWERVRVLYERYQFRDAQMLLIGENGKGKSGTVIDAMKDYLPDSEPAIQLLTRILCCYEYWDAGMYNEAAEMARYIKILVDFKPPEAVTLLDKKWVEAKQASLKSNLSNFYEDTSEFKAYVYDELARISRLIKFNCDYRSAFFRAGSLNEAMMLARLVRLIDNEQEKNDIIRALQASSPGATSVFENLQKPVGHRFNIGPQDSHPKLKLNGLKKPINIVIKNEMNWHKTINLFSGHGNWRKFIDIRNDLVHKYYSPPRSWTEDALKFVTANVENFWSPSFNTQDRQTSALPWSDLVNLTGLSNYLPPNLR
jgi:hypothetical protein